MNAKTTHCPKSTMNKLCEIIDICIILFLAFTLVCICLFTKAKEKSKLGGDGTFDNRPFTEKLHQFVKRKKKKLKRLEVGGIFWPILVHFWCPEVTLVNFSINLSNLKNNPKSS